MSGYIVVLGTNSLDEYYEMDTVPVMGEKVVCTHITNEMGGMLANAAAVFAGYGQKTYMIDFLNSGKYAQMIRKDMQSNGIDASYCTQDESIADSKCLVMLKDGERVIFVLPNLKKNLRLTAEQVALIKDSSFLYTTLSELRALDNTEEFVVMFRSAKARLALDIEPGTLSDKALDWYILSRAAVIFVNQGGSEKLEALYGDYIGQLNATECIVVGTKGKDGCAVHCKGQETVAIPGHEVPVVDTTGAGDTFNASFVHGMVHEWPLEKCARFANGAAAQSIGIFGPRGGVSTEPKVWGFLNNKTIK